MGDSPEKPVYIETTPKRGYRFVALFGPPEETSASTDSTKVSLEELGQAIMAAAGLITEEPKATTKDPQKP